MHKTDSEKAMLRHKMIFKTEAFGTALMSRGQIAKARRQHEGTTVGLHVMSKGEVAHDLNCIDAVLAFMLPDLELRDVSVGTAVFDPRAHFSVYANEIITTFDSLAYPYMFLNDFRSMIKAHGAVPIDGVHDEARVKIVLAFQTAQFRAQVFVGERVLIPFAGDYAYKGSDFHGTNGVVMLKPNTIKSDDLKLSITWLVEKIRVYAEQRLEISRMAHMWRIAISENEDTRMTVEFARTGKFTSSSARSGGKRTCLSKQGDLDNCLAVSEFKRKSLHTAFEESKLEHHRDAEEKSRTVWILINKCSPTMQQALQANSVDAVRLLWKSKLDSSTVPCK